MLDRSPDSRTPTRNAKLMTNTITSRSSGGIVPSRFALLQSSISPTVPISAVQTTTASIFPASARMEKASSVSSSKTAVKTSIPTGIIASRKSSPPNSGTARIPGLNPSPCFSNSVRDSPFLSSHPASGLPATAVIINAATAAAIAVKPTLPFSLSRLSPPGGGPGHDRHTG